MKSTRVGGPVDPMATAQDVVVTKTYTYSGTLSDTGSYSVTGQSIVTAFPYVATGTGNRTPFDYYRILKFSVFGSTGDGYIAATVVGAPGAPADMANFVDYGTSGSRRPVIHISPAFHFRNTWVPALTDEIMFIVYGANSAGFVLQITLEMRSEGGQATPTMLL